MFVGVFAIVVKRAFFAWEAAVLPLNYARGPGLLFIDRSCAAFKPFTACYLKVQLIQDFGPNPSDFNAS
jgi:hypothetical protein